jgi:MFS transporter, NNP family, nitrate/nitrite transporter
LIFYLTCIAITWQYYLRKAPAASGAPSLAEARV